MNPLLINELKIKGRAVGGNGTGEKKDAKFFSDDLHEEMKVL